MHYLDPVFSDFELCVIFNHLATLTSKNKFFNDFFPYHQIENHENHLYAHVNL